MSDRIEILAGTPAGGGQDRAARALAGAIEESTGRRPAIINIPGRGGGNAWDALDTWRGDPSVVAISSPTLVTNRLLRVAELDDRDLTPLANLYTEYIAFAVAADSPIEEPTILAGRLAAPDPPVVAFATTRGNINHMAIARVVRHGGGDPFHLRVRVSDSARHAVADVLAGQADVAAVSAPSLLPELAAGSVRVVAVSAPRRLADPMADVPTWTEAGIPCVIGTWRGVVGPAGLSDQALGEWDTRLRDAVATDAWRTELAHHGWADTFLGRTETVEFLEEARTTMGAALTDLGFR